MKLIRIFFTGLIISFLGTLPLGTLNISAMQIAVSDGVSPALYFVLGALLVEIFYVRVSLVAMDWVFKHDTLFRWLEGITVLIIAALAVSSFYAATQPGVHKNILLSGGINRFWLGVMMSAVNPVQIPFWFGWSTVLFTKKVIDHQNSHYNAYIAGIGTGTFIGDLVFIFGGRFIVDRLNANEKTLHMVIGCIFVITAIIMTWRIFNKKKAAAKII
ncbi:MAG: LysE family transporter [Chitinophagaceae bacterium]|nr:LysE family transporter [Chitinophagaceae bacterium]